MIYTLEFSASAERDISILKKSELHLYRKLMKLLAELVEHPTTGTGKPEPLKGNRAGQWSRRISKKHRLLYEIREEVVTDLILSSYGHYEDK